jgi:phosphotransferase system  glucose/maltose/N-acetylglucosamine-specific IIC component
MNADTLIHNFAKVIVNPIIALLFAVALVYFLWGVFQYFLGSSSEEARKTGAQHILWGVVGLMIMISAFGIINLVLGTFGISNPVSKELIP